MSDEVLELSREELLRRYGKKSTSAPPSTQRSPFKFLDSYDANDADIFFGRDVEIAELLRHFHSFGHVLIYGESGAGKSSLVHCGLRSRIPEADALFIPVRVNASGLANLSRQICEAASAALGGTIEVSPDADLIETLRVVREAASRPVVLFFDQFEELFIFHDIDARRRFATELAEVQSAKLNVKVIIGVRQDYLAHLSELENTVKGLFENRFWLQRMSRENAVQAVVKACQTCNVEIDRELAASILQSLDPGCQGVELPYLQVVMDRLYRQSVTENPDHPVITVEHVQKLGDIANILGTFLVEEVAKLPSPEIGRQILKAFVTRETTRRTLDRAAVAFESAGFGQPIAPDVLDAHLKQMVAVRILREIAEIGSFELRHDALAVTVASWISEVEKELIEVRDNLVNRFKEYAARRGQVSALLDRSFLEYVAVYRKRLEPLLNAAQSEYLQRSEQRFRRARKIRKYGIAGGIAVMLFAAIGIWMYLQYQNVQQARERHAIATMQLDFAKKAVKAMLSEIGSDALKDVPQMESVRAALLENALALFKDIGANDETGRFELAVAHYQVGDIRRILGSASDAALAETAYQEAIIQLETLCDDFPDNPTYQRQLGLAHMWLGELLRETFKDKRAQDAREQYDAAIEIQSKLANLSGENQDQFRIDLARSHMNRGIHFKDNALAKKKVNDFQGASQDFVAATNEYDLAGNLLASAGQNTLPDDLSEECQILLSKTHTNQAILLQLQLDKENLDRDKFEQAKKYYEQALDDLNKVIMTRSEQGRAERLEYSLTLAKNHHNIAILLSEFANDQDFPRAKNEARTHSEQALEIGKALNVGPRNARIEVAKFYDSNAWYHSLSDETKSEAVREYLTAMDVLETVLKQGKDDEVAKRLKAKIEANIQKLLAERQEK